MSAIEAADGGVSFWVPGKPITKGSLVPFLKPDGRGRQKVALADKPEATAWKSTMIKAIRREFGIQPVTGTREGKRVITGFDPAPFAGPVTVSFVAYFERLCEADHDMPYPTRESGMFAHGDGDKLERNLWDALTQSGLIEDDSNIVAWIGSKQWSTEPARRAVTGLGPGIWCEVAGMS